MTSARLPHVLAVLTAVGVLLTATACGDRAPTTADAVHRPPQPHGRPAPHEPARLDRTALDTGRIDIARLEPDLRAALEQAARAARADGVVIEVTSGWRSREHQQRLLDEAVIEYGSLDEALVYVATPQTSAHVTGDAVDVGPESARSWLSRHGSAYGLCQIFANETWHFELATTPGGTCPPMYADSSQR